MADKVADPILAQKRQEWATRVQKAQGILTASAGKPTEGQMNEVKTLKGEADALLVEIQANEQYGSMRDWAEQASALATNPAAGGAVPLGWRQAEPGEGLAKVDPKAWREIEVKTLFGTKRVRYNVPEAVAVKDYRPAFEAYLRKRYWDQIGPSDRKTLSDGVDTAGGFLVPEDYQAELLKKTMTSAVIRALARVAQTSRDMATWPRVNYTTDNKYTSGVRLSWTGEVPASATGARVTDPIFGIEKIPVHVAMASMPLTNSLIEDAAFDVIGYSSDLMGEAFALGEDDTFLNGTGVNQPMGMLTQVGSSETSTGGPVYTASGTSADIQTSSDAHSGKRILDLYYALPIQYRRSSSCSWIMNSATLKAVENLVDAQKRPLIQSLINASIATDEPEAIKGKRVAVDEFTPDIGASTIPIIFGDIKGYLVLDRVGISIMKLTELYAETDVTLLLARKRVGGFCTEPYRIKVMRAA